MKNHLSHPSVFFRTMLACALTLATVRAGDLVLEGSLTVETNLTVKGETAVSLLSAQTLQAGRFVNTNNFDIGTDCIALGGTMNTVWSRWSVVAGGYANQAGSANPEMGGDDGYDTVGGGTGNFADGGASVVAGGYWNCVDGLFGSIGGGSGNWVSEYASSVGGGEGNVVRSMCSWIGGGGSNMIDYSQPWTMGYSLIGGGLVNVIAASNQTACIVGGEGNRTMPGSQLVFVGGGYKNTVGGHSATIGGGFMNVASNGAFVGGGSSNKATGVWSTIPGGSHNTASGTNSFAAGLRAQALHGGSFVWNGHASGSPTTPIFASTTTNQFLVKAPGGVGINTNVTAGYALRVAGDVEVTGRLTTKQLQVTQAPSLTTDAVNYQSLTNHLASTGYIRNVVNGGTSGTTGSVTCVAGVATVKFPAGCTNAFTSNGSVPLSGNLLFAGGNRAIAATTSDGLDTCFVAISGGGVATPATTNLLDVSRGASVWAYGNENATRPGNLQLSAGVAPTSGKIILTTGSGYDQRLVIAPNAPASFEGGRIANVANAVAAQDAVNLQTAQSLIATALQNVGPFGNISMGSYTNRP